MFEEILRVDSLYLRVDSSNLRVDSVNLRVDSLDLVYLSLVYWIDLIDSAISRFLVVMILCNFSAPPPKKNTTRQITFILLMEEILHQLIGGSSHDLQGFIQMPGGAGCLPSTV